MSAICFSCGENGISLFCRGDLNCWGSWLFGAGAGAAWVQAVASLLLIVITNVVWRTDKARERKAEKKAYERNVAVFLGVMRLCHGALERLARDVSFVQCQVTVRIFHRYQEELRATFRAALPDDETVSLVIHWMMRFSEMGESMNQTANSIFLGSPREKIEREDAQRVVDLAQDFSEETLSVITLLKNHGGRLNF